MAIAIKDQGGIKIIYITGQLDTNTSPDMQQKLELLIQEDSKKLLVNLEDLSYISSAGLRVLLATVKSLKSCEGALRICCLNEMAQEVFNISGFNNILDVYSTEEEALKNF